MNKDTNVFASMASDQTDLYSQDGLQALDYVAIHAMNALLSSAGIALNFGTKELAKKSYDMAEAMINESNKRHAT